MRPSTTSPRLWGGMFVAMPTAIPVAPFTSRFGSTVGSTVGSTSAVVVVRLEVDRLLVDVLHHHRAQAGEPGLGVAHGRRGIAVDRPEVALAVHQGVREVEVWAMRTRVS